MSEQFQRVKYTVEMPSVAVFCSILAWISIVVGAFMLAGAIADSGYGKPDQTGLFVASFVVMFGSLLWFSLARIITLLAQIAHNTTTRPGQTPAPAQEIAL